MKTLRASLPFFFIAGATFAQVNPPTPPPAPVAPSAPESPVPPPALRSAEQLEQLLAPIALYPDALIALILPASVASTDIVLAARQLRDSPNDRSQIEHRAWDESVKSLTNYPEVLQWLDENLPWTKQVGEAFAQQPADVMQAVQRLRGRARTAGTLVDTPQQQVISEPDVIRIVPAQPDIVYVPRYEPDVVFIHEPVYYTRPLLTFGVGVRAGSWLAYECDWRRRTIWVGDRHRTWRGHDWRRPLLPIAPTFAHVPPGVRAWTPPRHTHTRFTLSYHSPSHSREIHRPSVIGSRPTAPRTWSQPAYTSPSPRTVHHTAPSPAASATTRTYSHSPRPAYVSPRATSAVVNSAPAQLYTSPSPSPAQVSLPAQPALVTREVPRRSSERSERFSRPTTMTPSPVAAVPQMTSPQPPTSHISSAQPRLSTRPERASPTFRSQPVANAQPAMATVAPAADAPPPSSVRPAENSSRAHSRGRRGDHDAQR